MGKWFAKLYDPFMAPIEKGGWMKLRKRLIQKAEGEVLEIGSGTGVNFPLYKREVSHVIALDPNPEMRKRSLKRVKQAIVPINLKEAKAERLPFMDQAFDTVIFTLVLCSVEDPVVALKEAKRVLKPGGKLLFFEHVRMDSRFLGSLQDQLTPVWKKLCDGCHLNRDTLKTIQEAGFQVAEMQSAYRGLLISGVAE